MLLGTALFVASVAIPGYRYPYANHSILLTVAQYLRDPSLYPRDPFVATLANYCSWYWVLVARLGGPDPAGLLLALFLLTNAGRLIAAALVARAMFPASRLAPWLAAALWAVGPRPLLGAGTLVSPYAEHTSTSVVFLLLAFGALLLDQPFWWALSFALGFLLNPMYGAHVLLYFALTAVLLLARRGLSWRWAWAALAWGALVAPGAIWSSRSMHGLEGGTADDIALWYRLAAARAPHHLFPLTWPWWAFALQAAVVAGVILGLRYGAGLGARTKAVMAGATGAALVWLGLGFVAAYAVRWPALLALHPVRGMDLFAALAGIFLVGLVAQRLEQQHEAGRALLWPVLGLIGAAGVWCVFKPWMAAGLLLVLGVVALASPLWSWLLRRMTVGQMRAVVCLLVGAMGLTAAAVRHEHGHPMVFVPYSQPALVDAARWAKTATPKDAIFLVDPATGAFFRPLSQRGVFVTWKDGGAFPWSLRYPREAARRMAELGYDFLQPSGYPPTGLLRRQGDDGLRRLAGKYALDYAVLEVTQPTRLPEVYRNDTLKIVAFRPPVCVTGPPATAPRAP